MYLFVNEQIIQLLLSLKSLRTRYKYKLQTCYRFAKKTSRCTNFVQSREKREKLEPYTVKITVQSQLQCNSSTVHSEITATGNGCTVGLEIINSLQYRIRNYCSGRHFRSWGIARTTNSNPISPVISMRSATSRCNLMTFLEGECFFKRMKTSAQFQTVPTNTDSIIVSALENLGK